MRGVERVGERPREPSGASKGMGRERERPRDGDGEALSSLSMSVASRRNGDLFLFFWDASSILPWPGGRWVGPLDVGGSTARRLPSALSFRLRVTSGSSC